MAPMVTFVSVCSWYTWTQVADFTCFPSLIFCPFLQYTSHLVLASYISHLFTKIKAEFSTSCHHHQNWLQWSCIVLENILHSFIFCFNSQAPVDKQCTCDTGAWLSHAMSSNTDSGVFETLSSFLQGDTSLLRHLELSTVRRLSLTHPRWPLVHTASASGTTCTV